MILEIDWENLVKTIVGVREISNRFQKNESLKYPDPVTDYQRGWNDAINRILEGDDS